MDNAGRIVLPKAIREQMHLSGGSKLEIEMVGDRIQLTPEAAPFEIKYDDDGLPAVAGWDGFDAAQAVKSNSIARREIKRKATAAH